MATFEPWIADCQFQQADDGAACHSRAAFWTEGRDSFRFQLADYAQRHGHVLLWVEDCHPVPDYLAKHPARQRDIGPMVRAVCKTFTVELQNLVAVESEE